MEDIEKIPSELQLKPKCLIYITGLDIENNQSHAQIWKGFSQNRTADRTPLKFKNVPFDHLFPPAKPKHQSNYEWSLPKGILKRHWMRKHLDELPSVVAIMFDLHWDEKQWVEKLIHCAKIVECVRTCLASRATKVVVVLIQNRVQYPMTEDLNATERAQEFCSQCQLPEKNLFALQISGFMFGCIKRLETKLYDMASGYYQAAAKRVKAHKSNINKTSHQLLFVRHEFKIAFFYELKQDQSLALKHYRQAYNNLLELRKHDLHILETKVVAGFINYKVCSLYFQVTPAEAISQFRRHIDFYKTIVGMPELAFEHEAWLSKQFELFGELFNDAIRQGLAPLLTQHPGLYYQEAARHTEARRRFARQLCSVTTFASESSVVQSSPVTSVGPVSAGLDAVVRVSSGAIRAPASPPAEVLTPSTDFFGQRPWRRAIQSLELPDQAKECEGIQNLQAVEAKVVHSNLIITLLTGACRYFEYCMTHRMWLYPAFVIAEEYFMKEEYEDALNNYMKIIDEFRKTGWNKIFTSISERVFVCAEKTSNHALVFSSALELMGTYSTLTSEEILAYHLRVFQAPDISEVDWSGQSLLTDLKKRTDSKILVVDATHLKTCIELKAAFLKPSFTIDEGVQLLLFLKSSAPLPLKVDSVHVKILHKNVRLSPIVTDSASKAEKPVESHTSVYKWSQSFDLEASAALQILRLTLNSADLLSYAQLESVQLCISLPLPRLPDSPDAGRRLQQFAMNWSFTEVAPLTAGQPDIPRPATLHGMPSDLVAKMEFFKQSVVALDKEETMNFVPKWEYFTNQLSTV